jgi:hypothetical protein
VTTRAVLALAVLLCCALAPASAPAATDLLPDLVADPPDNTELDYHAYEGGGGDLLLRFDGHVHNAGAGALDVRGTREGDAMVPRQRVYDSDGNYRTDAMPNAELFYTTADGHNHFHLQEIARYSLWAESRSAEVAPAQKVGFCLEDSQHVDDFGPTTRVYSDSAGRRFCMKDQPNATSLYEGVSSGWRDLYDSDLALQWVVVSDVRPGNYWLREDMDPKDVVNESDETAPPAWAASKTAVPGYVAKPRTPSAKPFGQPQQVTLAADEFGSPGPRRFKIVTPPAHGTLDVATGSELADASVTYTPAAGFAGADEFTYVALDGDSLYPRHPDVATVSLTVGSELAPRVVIGAAPAAVQARNGVQLAATVENDLPGITWSVDGVDGGSLRKGLISATGFYRAPIVPPPGGTVTIRARSASGAHDERVVGITASPIPPPSPAPADPERVSGSLLSRITRVLDGDVLAASVRPARAGVVSIAARVGSRKLGSCSRQTPKKRRFTCRLKAPPGVGLKRLKLTATLRRAGRTIATVTRSGAPRRL